MTDVEAAEWTRTLASVYAARWNEQILEILFAPEGHGTVFTLDDGFELLDQVVDESFRNALIPLCLVDERSIACVIIEDGLLGLPEATVVRLHLADVPPQHQLAVLDLDPFLYIDSLERELKARQAGLDLVLDVIGPAYQDTYLAHEKRPRDFIVRPVRIACQNVIVALGAISQDSTFDGLSVVAWQTCEVPHVATHEANRALTALTLSDAFQNGGTMEIRFDRPARISRNDKVHKLKGHPERGIPASLQRFARTMGIELGVQDPAAILPDEARALFLAVTPMPDGLRARVNDAIWNEGITPERLCFTLLSQTWREIELDMILGLSARAGSILEGGENWECRSARQAEMEICRLGLMTGMLYRRLNSRDVAAETAETRPVEDTTVGVQWDVLPELGAVRFTKLDPAAGVPWSRGQVTASTELTVFPRTVITAELPDLIAQADGPVAVAVPGDAPSVDLDVPVLRCPDRTADLDKATETKLLTSRIARG